jgi:hypothetical protein
VLARIVVLALLLPVCALGQQIDGIVDRDADAQVQIDQLEAILGGSDMAAERQAVMLLWLAELYTYVGNHAGVESSYLRILAFFPYDVGVMNRYAEFLLITADNSEKAESVLVAATQWGRYTDARSLNRGRTYELLAGVEMEKGDYPAAERHALLAIGLLDDDSSIGPRRVLAQTLHRTGAHDDAVEEYLYLIALDHGTNPEDINSVKLIVGSSDRYRDGDLNALIDEAIAARELEKKNQIEAEGAELVSIRTDDGVILEGTLRRRGDKGAVLLISGRENTRETWTPYAQLLGIDEISSLSLDLRGQGGSRSDSLSFRSGLSVDHRDRLPDDIVAGYRYLQKELGIPDGRLVVVGEGESCALVEKALRRGPLNAPVVYLSPVFESADRELADAISFHANPNALLFYSQEDLHSLQSTSYFKKKKDLQHLSVRVLDRAGHGIDVLRRNPGALEGFQDWLRRATGVQ